MPTVTRLSSFLLRAPRVALPMAALIAAAAVPCWVHGEALVDQAVTLASYASGRITLADAESVIAHKLPEERTRIASPGGVLNLVESLIRYDLLQLEARARGYENNWAVQDAVKHKASELLIIQRASAAPSDTPEERARVLAEHHN
jgi:hypothetical protein